MERVAVIMAGGGGVRLWPLSNPQKPKHMLPLISSKSLLRETIERILPWAGKDGVLVVTTRDMAPEVAREGGIPPRRVIAEPCRRNTAPAVALSTLFVTQLLGEETVMVILPADHYIHPTHALLDCLDRACSLAREGWLVTLGIPPTRPDTGYGYMETGASLSPHAFKVNRFREKPSLEEAQGFLAKGNYYWNSGIFVWQASTLWRELRTHLPQVAIPLEELKDRPWEETAPLLDRIYPPFPDISIDYAVMEKATMVAMVKATFQWCDVGSWSALREILDKNGEGNVLRGEVQAIETRDSLIWGHQIPVKVLGVEGLVVMATPQGVLVCPLEKSQEVKRLLEE